jgi:DNA mismatch endonuclease Vsr
MERMLREKLPKGKFNQVDPRHRRMMKQVRGKGNRTTEARFRGALMSAGISGWKLNFRDITGAPDFYFPVEQVAVFVDGCFWHGCAACGHVPRKNREFWAAKIARNHDRDRRNTVRLRSNGISVMRFWEHEIKDSLAGCILKVRAKLAERKTGDHGRGKR